jgi:hypothetical protein
MIGLCGVAGLIASYALMGVANAQTLTADPVNTFPIKQSAEAFVNKPTRVSVSFLVYFGGQDDKYLPVSESLAALLSSDPVVQSSAGMRVAVVRTICTPTEVIVRTPDGYAKATGGRVDTQVDVIPTSARGDTTKWVILSFPVLDVVFQRYSPQLTVDKAVVQIDVQTWASEAAKQKAQLDAEKREQERREQEEAASREAEAKARQAAEREEKERQAKDAAVWEERKRVGTPILAMLLFVLIILYSKRKWWWPELEVEIGRGQFTQVSGGLPGNYGEEVEVGTILATAWAKSLYGRRCRIKVETYASDVSSDQTKPRFSPLNSGNEYRVDVFVSTAATIRSGRYLATLPSGAVRVKVTDEHSISSVS